MPERGTLSLRILTSDIEVKAPASWLELLADLWSPFLVARKGPAGLSFTIEERDQTFILSSPNDEVFETSDPWVAILRLRVLLGRQSMDRAEGLIGLHGALVTDGDRVVILSGPAGAGKSTLAAELSRSGWRFGGDDLIALDPRDGLVVPLPFPIAFKEPVSLARAPSWQLPGWLPEPEGAFCIPPGLLGDLLLTPEEPWGMAALDRGAPVNGLTPVSVAEATVLLAGEGDRLTPSRLRSVLMAVGQMKRRKLSYSKGSEARELLGEGLWL